MINKNEVEYKDLTEAEKRRSNLIGLLYLAGCLAVPLVWLLWTYAFDGSVFSAKTDAIILLGVAPAVTILLITLAVWLQYKK